MWPNPRNGQGCPKTQPHEQWQAAGMRGRQVHCWSARDPRAGLPCAGALSCSHLGADVAGGTAGTVTTAGELGKRLKGEEPRLPTQEIAM